MAISVLGAWLAAVLAALLAETISPRRGPTALWLVGAMSPLTVDATWVLAHAPAAAAVAAMLLAGERAARLSPLTTPRRHAVDAGPDHDRFVVAHRALGTGPSAEVLASLRASLPVRPR